MLRWLVTLLVMGVLFAGVVAGGARFADGPVGPFPGGELMSGEWVRHPVEDWRFVNDVDTVELQLETPLGSRTTGILEDSGAAYIPCRYPNFTLWKHWPHDALIDGRAVVRIAGQRYRVMLEKVDDPDVRRRLELRLSEKWGTPREIPEDELWFFQLMPRSED